MVAPRRPPTPLPLWGGYGLALGFRVLRFSVLGFRVGFRVLRF